MPLVFLNIPRDHQASRNLQTQQIQRSALQRLRQLSAINFPPSTRHRLLTATTLPPSIAFRFITHSAIYRVFTKLKATVHLGLEPTHTAPFQPGDQRVNHHSTLSPRKFRLFGFELNRRVISDLTTRNIFSKITQPPLR